MYKRIDLGCYTSLWQLIYTHQHGRSSEQIAERVVHEVEKGGSVQVSVTHHLTSKEGLSRSATKQTASHAVAGVHLKSGFPDSCLNAPCIRLRVGAAIKCPATRWGN